MGNGNILWLVEEHQLEMGYGDETISLHAVVTAGSPHEAFRTAERQLTPSGADFGFAFSAEELEEVVPGYMWQAADGSSIAYEVRKLGPADALVSTPRPACAYCGNANAGEIEQTGDPGKWACTDSDDCMERTVAMHGDPEE
jgi:hypothetical protein